MYVGVLHSEQELFHLPEDLPALGPVELTGLLVQHGEKLGVLPARVVPGSRPIDGVDHALHAGDEKGKPLTEITFVAGGTQQLSVLRIVVPDDQPSGVYTGAIVDMKTGEPGGHLILRLF